MSATRSRVKKFPGMGHKARDRFQSASQTLASRNDSRSTCFFWDCGFLFTVLVNSATMNAGLTHGMVVFAKVMVCPVSSWSGMIHRFMP